MGSPQDPRTRGDLGAGRLPDPAQDAGQWRPACQLGHSQSSQCRVFELNDKAPLGRVPAIRCLRRGGVQGRNHLEQRRRHPDGTARRRAWKLLGMHLTGNTPRNQDFAQCTQAPRRQHEHHKKNAVKLQSLRRALERKVPAGHGLGLAETSCRVCGRGAGVFWGGPARARRRSASLHMRQARHDHVQQALGVVHVHPVPRIRQVVEVKRAAVGGGPRVRRGRSAHERHVLVRPPLRQQRSDHMQLKTRGRVLDQLCVICGARSSQCARVCG